MSANLARDVQLLAALFKVGGWTEIRIESDGLSLLLSEDGSTAGLGAASIKAPPSSQPAAAILAKSAEAPTVASVSSDTTIDPAWTAVFAPKLGTFYRSPKPGVAPFVEIGDRVDADTEICLLEVMKLFTSVKAGVAGTVRRIGVADGALVEGGQLLIHIEGE